MSLKCLTIIDDDQIKEEIHQIVLDSGIQIIQDNRYLLNPAKITKLGVDLLVVRLNDSALAISLLEDFCRRSPNTTLIYLLSDTIANSASLMFFKAIGEMVDRVLPEEEIYKIAEIIQEVHASSYHLIKKIITDTNFSNREIEILTAMQMGVGVEDICLKLNIGKQAVRKHLSNCSLRLGCSKDAVVAMSFRILGDLTERTAKESNYDRS